MIDWISIKNEYLNTATSYRKLAEKYNVSTTAIANKAKSENWTCTKAEHLNKTCAKIVQETADKIVTKEVNRIDRILSASDTLLNKLVLVSSDAVDGKSIKQLTSALKDLRDISVVDTDNKSDTSLMQALIDIVKGDD